MIAEPILNALLHLFAMLAARLDGPGREAARAKVLAYLNHHVRLADTATYVGLYKDFIELHEGEDEAATLESAGQVAVRLKALLHGFEKYAAVIRFLELAAIAPDNEMPRRIAARLSRELGLDADTIERIRLFLADPGSGRILGGEEGHFHGRLAALPLPEDELFLVAPVDNTPVWLEGHPLEQGACHPLRPGQVIRDQWGNELYFASFAAAFAATASHASRIDFRGSNLDFRFPGGASGLHDFTFAERGGRLVGIMGGSGAGKSTLLGILNGTLRPNAGRLTLNGRDIYAEPEAGEGVIGFVPQDDLLFEDLTVFENLYYAARLCLAHLDEVERVRRVRKLLAELGQAETADLKVGSPLQKTISGGQRKRLNIALELIREPDVLFVDEPTSGLSSADSEIVMSLLREQAARDKLVFVVIHQPSSKIYRMFDALWILDQGGWPIFNGTPLEAVAYFRSRGGIAGAAEAICANCGGVNPEQIFEIIESKTLDKGGRYTCERRIAPEKWHALYREYAAEKTRADSAADRPPANAPPLTGNLSRPGRLGQLWVFLARDVRARLANWQYLLITLLEPPLLGLLIGLVARGAFGGTYSFHQNNNLHVFFFMSVMVALFLGLSVSAEEICRDRRILQRERFLHLSWWSYITSKTLYLGAVAAVQMLLYTAVANRLVEVPDMFLKSWAMLFMCALCSSVLGLNISAAFRSAVTIYILIPLLLIPQMLLCGVVIKYDDLIASNTLRREVPRYANLLPPRWGYEALIVEQYVRNDYMRHVLEPDAILRQAEYDLDYYLPELLARVKSIPLLREPGKADELAAQLRVLRGEFERLERRTQRPSGLRPADFAPAAFSTNAARLAENYLADIRRLCFERRRAAAIAKRAIEDDLERKLGRAGVEQLKQRNTNVSIQRQVLNLHDLDPVGDAPDGLFQRTLPIYLEPESAWGEAHFLARHKHLGTWVLDTYLFNMLALWVLTLLLYLALYFRLLPRLVSRSR